MEKRLLGKKVTEEDVKNLHKENKKIKTNEIIENGSKDKKKPKQEKFDEDPLTLNSNSSKRTVYVNSNDPSLCEICMKVWPAKKHLWQHYIRCHKQVAATVCGICLKTNPSYSSLQTHLRQTHPNLLHGCGFGSNFICKICGRYHNASSKLKLHMAIHVGFNESMMDSFDLPKLNVMQNIKSEIKHEAPQSDEDSSDYDTNENMNDNDVQEMADYTDNIADDMEVIKVEIKEEHEELEDINYENLIEEVEVYSESEVEYNNEEDVNDDNEDNDVECNNEEEVEIEEEEENEEENVEDNINSVTSKQSERDLSTSDDDQESDEEGTENDGTENELEQEMLKNMLGENVIVTKQEFIDDSSNDESQGNNYIYEIKEEIDTSEYIVEAKDIKMEVCSSGEWTHLPKLIKMPKLRNEDDEKVVAYQRKELDNAIRSISYDDCNDSTDYDVNVGLTEAELETAVGSIL